jgi:hypothetical protein
MPPSTVSTRESQEQQLPTDTTANTLGWTGRGLIGVSLVGFIISASGVVGWEGAAVTFSLMVAGACFCAASEIKKECSRPKPTPRPIPITKKETKPFYDRQEAYASNSATDATPVMQSV